MKILIIKFIITYLCIATYILFNLLFNKRLTFGKINRLTGEIKPASTWLLIICSLCWIIFIPIILINKFKYEKE